MTVHFIPNTPTSTVTRDSQQTGTIYLWAERASWQAFTTPDGVGRYFYPLTAEERTERGLSATVADSTDPDAIVDEVIEVEGNEGWRIVVLERYTD